MNILFKLAPHAAIVIGNMYYVFWGIDRVNKSMNFIDNPYTKVLLALLCAFSGITAYGLLNPTLRRLQRTKNPAPIYVRLGLLGLNALLIAIIAVMLVIDLFAAGAMIFLNEFVKVVVLALCIISLLNGILAIARDRASIRMMNRRAAQRRQAAQRTAQPQPARRAPQSQQPARRYPDGYDRTRSSESYGRSTQSSYSRSGDGYSRSSGSYSRSGDSYGRSSGSYSRSGDGYSHSSGSYSRSGDGYSRSSGSYSRSGDGYSRSSGSYSRSGDGYSRSSGSYSRSGDGYSRSSGSYSRSSASGRSTQSSSRYAGESTRRY